jgi:hypothetical protein
MEEKGYYIHARRKQGVRKGKTITLQERGVEIAFRQLNSSSVLNNTISRVNT